MKIFYNNLYCEDRSGQLVCLNPPPRLSIKSHSRSSPSKLPLHSFHCSPFLQIFTVHNNHFIAVSSIRKFNEKKKNLFAILFPAVYLISPKTLMWVYLEACYHRRLSAPSNITRVVFYQPGWRIRYSDLLWAGRPGDRIPVGGEIFRTRPHPPSGQPSLLSNGQRDFFPRVKRPRSGVNHKLSSGAEVKERVELYLYSTSEILWPVLGWSLPLPLASVPTRRHYQLQFDMATVRPVKTWRKSFLFLCKLISDRCSGSHGGHYSGADHLCVYMV
jgi:hypothetical protein